MSQYPFLAKMYEDDYFPTDLVDKGKSILVRLCESIEAEKPGSLEDVSCRQNGRAEGSPSPRPGKSSMIL